MKISNQQVMLALITAHINNNDYSELSNFEEFIKTAQELSNLDNIDNHPMNIACDAACNKALKQVTDWMKNVIRKQQTEV